MATKDFRVRLSAEGQQEVVSAFRRVQQEAGKSKQSAVDASKGFDQLKDSAHALAIEFLGYEAGLRVFEGIKGAVEGSIEFAASMGKLQEKTGLSATSLQVWSAAAKRVDVDQQTVSKGLGLFSKAIGNMEQGGTKAALSLQILLGSTKALNGLTADEKLRKVTDALSKMSAGSQRAKITTDLFGKSGLELLPVIDQLGGEGFDKLAEKLKSFGALLDDNAIQEAKAAEETLGDLKLAGQGLAMQFTEGMLPAITNVAGALASLAGDAQGGGNAIKQLGTDVGDTTKQMIFGFAYAMIKTREYLDVLVADLRTGGKLLETWHPFRDFSKIMAEGKVETKQAVTNMKTELQGLYDMMNAGDTAQAEAAKKTAAFKAGHDKDVIGVAQAAERLARAKTALEVERAQAHLALVKETNRSELQFEEERWKLGLVSVTAYYEKRQALARAASTDEQNALKAEIAAKQNALAHEKDPARKLEIEKAILELQAKADVDRIRSETEIGKLVEEEVAEREKLAYELLSFEDKVLEAQGKRHEMEKAAIQKESEEYKKRLTEAGDPNADAKVEQFQKVLNAQADYKEANRKLEESEKKLGEARRVINDKAEDGLISQREKKRELIKLDQQWQPILAAQLAALQAISKTSALAPLIDEAAEATQKVNDLNAALKKTKDTNAALEKAFAKSVGEDLHKFLSTGTKDAKELKTSFEVLALSIASQFAGMLAKMIGNKSNKGGGGGSGSSGDSGLFGFLNMFKPQQNDAGGEITHGPYGRDRVPSWLTRGEFVIRKPVVQQPGMRLLLNAINQGVRTPALVKNSGPRFDTGGEVSQTSGGMVLGGGNKSSKAHLEVGLDWPLLLKGLESQPGFGSVIVKHLGDNRNAANSALGK